MTARSRQPSPALKTSSARCLLACRSHPSRTDPPPHHASWKQAGHPVRRIECWGTLRQICALALPATTDIRPKLLRKLGGHALIELFLPSAVPIRLSIGRKCSSSPALGTPRQHPNAARQNYLDETACSQSDLPSDEHLKNRVLTSPSVTSITIGSRTFRSSV